MFDMDGTLVDSIGIYYRIVDIVFEKLGIPPVSREKIILATQNGDFEWDHVLPRHMHDRKDELTAKALEMIYEIYPDMFGNNLKLIPGAAAVLRAIASDGMKIGIVTSTPREAMVYKLPAMERAGVLALPEVIITGDDVKHKKPDPEPLLTCMRKLKAAKDRCVYVGDMSLDIRAGKAAGMKTIGVLTGFDNFEALEREAPDFILDSVDHLHKALVFRRNSN
jgi:2-phosphoglycolate phosphatase